ncbi:MAG: hypothetical protein Q7Q71_11390 [Verrucomicrobiota bacterium JB023]|nr:hypothetical protein [Verrucomicrobiota bacterium JB023]
MRQAKRPWWAKGLLLLGGVLVVLLIAGVIGVRVYLNSAGFRALLEGEMEKVLGGEVAITGMKWNGTSARVEAVTVDGPAGEWEAARLETEVSLSRFWQGAWLIPQLRISRVDGEWVESKGGEKLEKSSSGKARPKKIEARGGFFPQQVELAEWHVERWDGEFLPLQGPSWEWQDINVRGAAEGDGQVLTFVGGGVESPWPWLGFGELAGARARIFDERFVLEGSDWRVKKSGRLNLAGEWADGVGKGDGDFADLELHEVLPASWWGSVEGTASGEFALSQVSDGGVAVEGSVAIVGGVLANLPFLDRLAAYAGSRRFQRLLFEEAHADFRWQQGEWTVRDLVLEHRGLLRVTGALTVRGENLEGRLQVGVPRGLLAHLPGAEEKVFLPGEKGLLWAPVQLSGTWRHPKEDLSGRMIQAAGERMFELVPETGAWALRYAGESLDQGTAVILQNQEIILREGSRVAEETLRQGSDVVEEGIGIGSGLLRGILGNEKEEDE